MRRAPTSKSSAHVKTDDVRSLLRLVGEIRELSSANEPTTPHLLDGLSKLTGSVAASEFAIRFRPNSPWEALSVTEFGWTSETDKTRIYDHALSTPIEDDVLMSEIARSSEQVATVARADVMTTRDWHRSFKFNEIYGPSQIADSMVSLMRVNANANADANGRLFVFKRALNDGAFSERERELVTLLLSECRWLHEVPEGSRSSRLEALSRREREVLKILLTGAPEKGVASLLGISRHTAHQYVKSIYRKLAVTSRAQLMAERTLPRELVKSA